MWLLPGGEHVRPQFQREIMRIMRFAPRVVTCVSATLVLLAGPAHAVRPTVLASPGDCDSGPTVLNAQTPNAAGLGSGVAIHGMRIAAGAPSDSIAGTNAGAAYLFERTADDWAQVAILVAGDPEPSRFGHAIAMTSDTVLVGAPYRDDLGNQSGAAHVFRGGPGGWFEEAMFTAFDGGNGDRFGIAVSIHGDLALVGSPNWDHPGSQSTGAVYVYRHEQGTWTLEGKILPATLTNGFGRSVDFDGELAIVGAHHDSEHGTQAGAAFVYQISQSATRVTWFLEDKLLPCDGSPSTEFGYSVAIDGSRVIVGRPGDAVVANYSGSAYSFRRHGSAGPWQQEAKLVPADGVINAKFGASVDLRGGRAVIGAPDGPGHTGGAYLFRQKSGSWLQVHEFPSAASNHFHGTDVAIGADFVAVGIPGARAVHAWCVSSVDGSSCHSSQSSPPQPSDTRFLVDCGTWLDTCVRRDQVPGGRLSVPLLVDRHIGPVDGDGHLIDAAQLAVNGVVSGSARLLILARRTATSGTGAPLDRVLFNGVPVPSLFGTQPYLSQWTGTWFRSAFSIPIELVKFAGLEGNGQARVCLMLPESYGCPVPGVNLVEIELDVGSMVDPDDVCLVVDWMTLDFEAAPPVLLLHGLNSGPEMTWCNTWLDGSTTWPQLLTDRGLLYDAIDLGEPDPPGPTDSMRNNAVKIGLRVAEMQNRWGVDKVILYGQSKGGLDARYYVNPGGGAANVARVIQTGSPNAGSKWADVAYLICVFTQLFLQHGDACVEALPAHMEVFNSTYASTKGVDFIALAGDYSFDLCIPFLGCADEWLELVHGEMMPNDWLVTVESVFAMDAARHLGPIVTAGSQQDALHDNLPRSQLVFDQLEPYLFLPTGTRQIAVPGTVGSRAPMGDGGTPPSAGQQAELLMGVAVAGGTTMSQALIDAAPDASFALFYSNGDLDLTLESPSGVMIDPVSAASMPGVLFVSNEAQPSGRSEWYHVSSPEPGTWTVRVFGADVAAPRGEGFSVTTWVGETDVTMDVEVDAPVHPIGGVIQISAMLDDAGTPITGVGVTATISRPDGSNAGGLALLDDGLHGDGGAGDGTYANSFVDTTQPGVYLFDVSAQGRAAGPFHRQAQLSTIISASSSVIVGVPGVTATDVDVDGLLDTLQFDVMVDVDVAGTFALSGRLVTSQGDLVALASAQMELPLGPTTWALSFEGEDVFESGLDGPYVLTDLRLVETGGQVLATVDHQTDVYVTAPYSHFDFEHAHLVLTGVNGAVAHDTDGDGDFDAVDVSIGVDAHAAGVLDYSVQLSTSSGGCALVLASTSGSQALPPGPSSLKVRFDGSTIGSAGLDGPYDVVNLLVTRSELHPFPGSVSSSMPSGGAAASGVTTESLERAALHELTGESGGGFILPAGADVRNESLQVDFVMQTPAFSASAFDAYVIPPDCNSNGIPDPCDVASGSSLDVDFDGVPDECGP